jgi:16S rRNA (cytidine1402-2'-O)-methyltransferase
MEKGSCLWDVAICLVNDIKPFVSSIYEEIILLLSFLPIFYSFQSFAFNGYLPIDKSEKKSALKSYEKLSFDKNQSQLFIETPYRNNKLVEDLLQTLQPNTNLCIACDITLPTEYIKTFAVKDWKKQNVDLHNRPTIFIIHKTY